MKLKRIESGHYKSADGRVEIRREVSHQSRGPNEISWSVWIDGRSVGYDTETKTDAVALAVKRLGVA